MRHNPPEERRDSVRSTGRHRTVMAAVVRPQSGPQPAVSRASSAREERSELEPPPSDPSRDPQVIFDREDGQLPAHIPSLTLPHPAPRSPVHSLALVGRRAVAASRVLVRRSSAASRPAVIPGRTTGKRPATLPRAGRHETPRPLRTRPFAFFAACLSLVLAVSAAGVTARSELGSSLSEAFFQAQSGVHVLPTPIGGYWEPPIDASVNAAPSFVDAAHYVNKYGFDWPTAPEGLSADERARLMIMMPFALAATARWDARFGDALEPQMLLFWTHAEGITGHVNYSNCANEYPPGGYSYFSYITNCNDPGFWQLGYGNQFGVIDILKTAFTDMRGDPNDPALVQRVGQAVLNWDRRQGTSPVCGGYTCTFPAKTIDQIMAGVSLTHPTDDDWWASVLSRDPAINCYMLARALVWFNHNATRNWVGCYYAEPCWSYESNRLGDILAAWGSLRAGV